MVLLNFGTSNYSMPLPNYFRKIIFDKDCHTCAIKKINRSRTCTRLKYYRRKVFNCEYLLIANCEFLSTFAINRFANMNVHVYYNTVWGQPSQLLDL